MLTRLALIALLVVVAWFLLQAALGLVFSLIRGLMLLVLFGVIAWIVLIGPPGGRD
jgi:hypothetical protein